MRSAKTLASATVALLITPAIALAQASGPPAPAAPPGVPAMAPPTAAPPAAMAPSASTAGIDASAQTMPATEFPPAQADALARGDNAVVTNGPIPDTAANRAKYGQPLSHAGKVSPPVGN